MSSLTPLATLVGTGQPPTVDAPLTDSLRARHTLHDTPARAANWTTTRSATRRRRRALAALWSRTAQPLQERLDVTCALTNLKISKESRKVCFRICNLARRSRFLVAPSRQHHKIWHRISISMPVRMTGSPTPRRASLSSAEASASHSSESRSQSAPAARPRADVAPARSSTATRSASHSGTGAHLHVDPQVPHFEPPSTTTPPASPSASPCTAPRFAQINWPGSGYHKAIGLVMSHDDERNCHNWTMPLLETVHDVHIMFENLETIAIDERKLRPAVAVSFSHGYKQNAAVDSRIADRMRMMELDRRFAHEQPRDRSYTSSNAFGGEGVMGVSVAHENARSLKHGFDAVDSAMRAGFGDRRAAARRLASSEHSTAGMSARSDTSGASTGRSTGRTRRGWL